MNERIRAHEILVIGAEGEQLGQMTPEAAIAKAVEVGLDLVEVAPNAKPPVCRIMDYGKYKYEQKKKTAAGKAKGKGRTAQLKEVKMRPATDEHGFPTRRHREHESHDLGRVRPGRDVKILNQSVELQVGPGRRAGR